MNRAYNQIITAVHKVIPDLIWLFVQWQEQTKTICNWIMAEIMLTDEGIPGANIEVGWQDMTTILHIIEISGDNFDEIFKVAYDLGRTTWILTSHFRH
jgi:hypothetical protein